MLVVGIILILLGFIALFGGMYLGNKSKNNGILVVSIFTFLITIFIGSICVNEVLVKEPVIIENVVWKDNIHNPNNSEFVNEVVFNLNDTLIIKDLDYTLQYEFCKRYYNDLDSISKVWFKQQKE